MKIITKCKERLLPAPIFSELGGGLCIEFKKGKVPQEEKGKGIPKTVEETVDKILTSMKDNPKITVKQLEKITGLTRRGLEWNIDKFKKKKLIARIGPTKGGSWKVK